METNVPRNKWRVPTKVQIPNLGVCMCPALDCHPFLALPSLVPSASWDSVQAHSDSVFHRCLTWPAWKRRVLPPSVNGSRSSHAGSIWDLPHLNSPAAPLEISSAQQIASGIRTCHSPLSQEPGVESLSLNELRLFSFAEQLRQIVIKAVLKKSITMELAWERAVWFLISYALWQHVGTFATTHIIHFFQHPTLNWLNNQLNQSFFHLKISHFRYTIKWSVNSYLQACAFNFRIQEKIFSCGGLNDILCDFFFFYEKILLSCTNRLKIDTSLWEQWQESLKCISSQAGIYGNTN